MLTGSIAGNFQGPVMADRWCTKGVCFPIVSNGIATTVNGDLAATISAAERALYEAKNLGRNLVVEARTETGK